MPSTGCRKFPLGYHRRHHEVRGLGIFLSFDDALLGIVQWNTTICPGVVVGRSGAKAVVGMKFIFVLRGAVV